MQKILQKQLLKVQSHYDALLDYKMFIERMYFDFSVDKFQMLEVTEKAVLEAYLKRFASLQDFLGAKVFKTLLAVSGISYSKMSEVLILMEKEEIITLDRWIEFRTVRNNLEHDYPDELTDALYDLKYCVEHFDYMHDVVQKVFDFAGKYNASI